MEVITRGIDTKLDPDDSEGRVLVTKCGSLTCINIYLPNGGSGPARQAYKDQWLEDLLVWAKQYLSSPEPVVLVGDLNIAHTEDDIWNPKGNARNSGFLPHERAWFSDLLADGWLDAFRHKVGDGAKVYSWWSNRGQARAKDRGWRIDYFLLNPAAAEAMVDCTIVRQGGIDVSDHAPVVLDLDI